MHFFISFFPYPKVRKINSIKPFFHKWSHAHGFVIEFSALKFTGGGGILPVLFKWI